MQAEQMNLNQRRVYFRVNALTQPRNTQVSIEVPETVESSTTWNKSPNLLEPVRKKKAWLPKVGRRSTVRLGEIIAIAVIVHFALRFGQEYFLAATFSPPPIDYQACSDVSCDREIATLAQELMLVRGSTCGVEYNNSTDRVPLSEQTRRCEEEMRENYKLLQELRALMWDGKSPIPSSPLWDGDMLLHKEQIKSMMSAIIGPTNETHERVKRGVVETGDEGSPFDWADSLYDLRMGMIIIESCIPHTDKKSRLSLRLAVEDIQNKTDIRLLIKEFTPPNCQSRLPSHFYLPLEYAISLQVSESISPGNGQATLGPLDKDDPYNRRRPVIIVGPQAPVDTILHEIGHVLGLSHEHQRPDRDQYVTLIDADGFTGQERQNNFHPQCLSQQESTCSIFSTEYNCRSVMHYNDAFFKPSASCPATRTDCCQDSDLRETELSRLSRTDAQAIMILYFGKFEECKYKPFNPCKNDPYSKCIDSTWTTPQCVCEVGYVKSREKIVDHNYAPMDHRMRLKPNETGQYKCVRDECIELNCPSKASGGARVACVFNPPSPATCECVTGYKAVLENGDIQCVKGVELQYNETMPNVLSKLTSHDSQLESLNKFRSEALVFIAKAKELHSCGTGWWLTPDKVVCVKEINLDYEHHEAAAYCRAQGGSMVTIRSESMNEFIAGLRTEPHEDYWIGLRRMDCHSSFYWDSGEAVGYRKWREDEPRGIWSHCVEMVDGTSRWATAGCGYNSRFFCEKKPSN